MDAGADRVAPGVGEPDPGDEPVAGAHRVVDDAGIDVDEAHRLGMVNEVHPAAALMDAAHEIAEKIAGNSPTAVQAVKRAVQLGEGQPVEQAIAIMMDAHWRSAVHPDRVEGIGAFNEGRDPTFLDSDF